MAGLEKYLTGKRAAELDPLARSWVRLLTGGGATRAECEVWRRKEVLGFAPAKLHVTFYGEANSVLKEDHVDWNVERNEQLIKLHVRAVSRENECVRYGLVLRDRLRRVETRFGDGYYNSVLVEYVKGSPFANQTALVSVLDAMKEYEPDKGGAAYGDCVEAIETILVGAGQSLTLDGGLKYSELEGEEVLSKALSLYLDERFSVSDRAAFGW